MPHPNGTFWRLGGASDTGSVGSLTFFFLGRNDGLPIRENDLPLLWVRV